MGVPHGMPESHAATSYDTPVQLAPPNAGAGLVHVRVCEWTPPPQYELFGTHVDQSAHALQLPFTAASGARLMCAVLSIREAQVFYAKLITLQVTNERKSHEPELWSAQWSAAAS